MANHFRKLTFRLLKEATSGRKFSEKATMVRSEAIVHDILTTKPSLWDTNDATYTLYNITKLRTDNIQHLAVNKLLPFVISLLQKDGSCRYKIDTKINITLKEIFYLKFSIDLYLRVMEPKHPLKRKFVFLQGKKLVTVSNEHFENAETLRSHLLDMARQLSNTSLARRTLVLGFGEITAAITGKEVALLAWSMGKTQSPSKFNSQYDSLLHETHRQGIPLSFDDSCMILWCAAKMKNKSSKVIQVYQDCIPRIQILNTNRNNARNLAGQCARLVWAGAQLSLDIELLLRSCEKQITSSKLSVKHVSNVLWAMATTRICHTSVISHMLKPTSMDTKTVLSPDGFATCLWSVSVLSVPTASDSVKFFTEYYTNYNKTIHEAAKPIIISNTKILGAIFFAHGQLSIPLPDWVVDNTITLLKEGFSTDDFIKQITSYLGVVNKATESQHIPTNLIPVMANVLERHWSRLSFKTITSCLYFSACYDIPPGISSVNILDRLTKEMEADEEEQPENKFPLRLTAKLIWSVTSLRIRHVDIYQESARTIMSRQSELKVIDAVQLLWSFHTIGSRLESTLLDVLLKPFLQTPHEANILDVTVLSFTLVHESVSGVVMDALINRIYELQHDITPERALMFLQYLHKLGLPDDHELLKLLESKSTALLGAHQQVIQQTPSARPSLAGSPRPHRPYPNNKRQTPRPVDPPSLISNFPLETPRFT